MAADSQANSDPVGAIEASPDRTGELHDQLKAILAADVAGYSRLMGTDEHGTILGLDAVRATFRGEIEANGGRVVDMAGDSVLALFGTAAGALAAALAAQEHIEAAASRQPEDRRMRVRIGLHLGDVIVKPDGSVYGNGVNIAARLQAMARLGGICVSQVLYDTVKRRFRSVDAECGGPQSFKNIAEPVVVWHVSTDASSPGDGRTAPGRSLSMSQAFQARAPLTRRAIATLAIAVLLAAVGGWWLWSKRDIAEPAVAADRKAIAVLPFASISEDKSNAYFADGMQEDLLTQLAQLGELKVVSRTSVAEYRNTRKNLRQVGAELGVGSVVEGSVRSAGGRVRVSVQLIDARTDKHLWAQSYDRELRDIFAIQSELATEIARALKVSLTPREEMSLGRKPTENLEAYELLRRFEELDSGLTTGSNAATGLLEKIALLSRAVELDPGLAVAWARLAEEHARARFWNIDRSEGRLQAARHALDRALAIAPDDITVRTFAGSVYYYGYTDYVRAGQYFEDLLRVVPHHVETLNRLAWVRRRQGRFQESRTLQERALAVDVRNVLALRGLADSFISFRDFDRAIAVQRRILEIRPGNVDAEAALHDLEFLKSGTFAAYDGWRERLPAGAERALRVLEMDARRAWSRRDFDSASRIEDATPHEPTMLHYEGLPHALLAKGERSKALQVARALVSEDTKALERSPRDARRLIRIAFAKAILGDREAAHARFREAWAIFAIPKDVGRWNDLMENWSYVRALLGEREETLALLRESARRPGDANSPHVWRTNPFYLKLWDDPEFQALVNDPATNAQLPIADWEWPQRVLP